MTGRAHPRNDREQDRAEGLAVICPLCEQGNMTLERVYRRQPCPECGATVEQMRGKNQ